MQTSPNPDRTDNRIAWTGWLIAPVAIFNVATLLGALYAGTVHPVRYELLLPDGATWRTVLTGWSILASFVLIAGLAIAGQWNWLRWNEGRSGHEAAPQARALAPAVFAPAWLIVYAGDPRVDFLILTGCILLIGWSLARLVSPPGQSAWITQATAPPKAQALSNAPIALSPSRRWWFEGLFLVVFVLSLVAAAFHTWVQIKLHNALQYGAPDIGHYAEMLVNATRRRGLWCEAYGHDYFGEHISPGLYLLVPLWMCWPSIHMLMALGAASVSSGALAVYALTRAHNAPRGVAAALAIAFLAYPSTSRVIYGASYGFHEILLVIPLMLWSFHFWQRRRWRSMIVCVLLAISFKENVAIVYACFGMYMFLGDRGSRRGLWLCAACIGYFLVAVMWVVPAFNQAGIYSKSYLYAGLGDSPTNILSAILRDPSLVSERILSWQAMAYAVSLGVPLAMLIFVRPVTLVALPTLAFTCLMDNPSFASVRFWHQSSALPVLWLAVIQAVARCPRDRRRTTRRAAAVLFCAGLMHYALGFSPASRTWRDFPLDRGDRSELIQRLDEMIPDADSVQATPRLASHFYDRAHLYPLDADLATPVDWVLLDSMDSFLAPAERPSIVDYRAVMRADTRYEHALHAGTIDVFRLSGSEFARRDRIE